MKPKLVIGLGNRLIPEDAIGLYCFDQLRALAAGRNDVDFVEGGTDLLRMAPYMRNRELIILIDAVDDPPTPLMVIEHGAPELSEAQQHAHHLSAVQALNLIRWTDESVKQARCVWVLLDATTAHKTRSGSQPTIS
jgi:hydrogenase maturation protease